MCAEHRLNRFGPKALAGIEPGVFVSNRFNELAARIGGVERFERRADGRVGERVATAEDRKAQLRPSCLQKVSNLRPTALVRWEVNAAEAEVSESGVEARGAGAAEPDSEDSGAAAKSGVVPDSLTLQHGGYSYHGRGEAMGRRTRSAYRRAARLRGGARCVSTPLRYAARELSSRQRTCIYKLRENGLSALIRHPLIDSWVLEEIYGENAYLPPDSIQERLQSLGRPPRIVDLGGHAGLFGLYILGRFPDATVLSFEPDADNLSSLRACVTANGFESRWEIVPAAAGRADGEIEFVSNLHLSHAGADVEAIDSATLRHIFPFLAGGALMEEQRTTVSVQDCFPALGDADLVKIDIEGGEWPLLEDSRLRDIGAVALVLECHRTSAPSDNPGEYAHARLREAGFEIVNSRDASGEALLIWAAREAS